ncbi:MAG TPA: Fic family protein [Gammaproteobacteria bacterium]|nr:Fic family protein [Gammaproteobacteria bacterium]
MADPSEKLAASLEALHALQKQGLGAIRSKDLSRTHRERLVRNGFLQGVIRGWYIPARPGELPGDSTAWYASFWSFCAAYLNTRFAEKWCLAPEQSLSLQAGNRAVPRQLSVRAPGARNRVTDLSHDTSILEIRARLPEDAQMVEVDGLRVFSLEASLIFCQSHYFQHNPTDVRSALALVRDASDVLALLLKGGHSTVAGRLAGAFRNIGRGNIADQILMGMRAAGFRVTEQDPFRPSPSIVLPTRERSPYVNRIHVMWQTMREQIIPHFPAAPKRSPDIDIYLKSVDEVFVTDAYHSLSIEGYRVSPDLIERVRSGTWNPDHHKDDSEARNAMAARGYWLAFQAVKKSLKQVLREENPGLVAGQNHALWYQELFAPSVEAGILQKSDLAGYRNDQVYIRRSMHTPPSREAVRDCMPALFDLLREETEPAVRIVLGHFMFVYIHPYMDGNGRIGRFLMNVMLAAGGYPWTVIPLEERNAYMAALEEASVDQNIAPFSNFLARLVDARLKGKATPKLPSA